MSHLVSDLRPSQLDHLGLAAALRSLVKDYQKRFDLEVDLKFAGQRRRLDADLELALFRIAQESLTNVVRHAQVKQVQVQLCFAPEKIELCIIDNGVGFLPEATQDSRGQHWGVLGMAERATQLQGSLDIQSDPGTGTQITASFPLNGKGE